MVSDSLTLVYIDSIQGPVETVDKAGFGQILRHCCCGFGHVEGVSKGGLRLGVCQVKKKKDAILVV